MPENPLKKIKEKGVDHKFVYPGAAVVSVLFVIHVWTNVVPQAMLLQIIRQNWRMERAY